MNRCSLYASIMLSVWMYLSRAPKECEHCSDFLLCYDGFTFTHTRRQQQEHNSCYIYIYISSVIFKTGFSPQDREREREESQHTYAGRILVSRINVHMSDFMNVCSKYKDAGISTCSSYIYTRLHIFQREQDWRFFYIVIIIIVLIMIKHILHRSI